VYITEYEIRYTACLFDCNCGTKQQLRVAVILWTCMWEYQFLIFTELLATSPSDWWDRSGIVSSP